MGMNGLKGRGPRRKKTTDEKIKRQQGKLKDVDRGENGGEEGRKKKERRDWRLILKGKEEEEMVCIQKARMKGKRKYGKDDNKKGKETSSYTRNKSFAGSSLPAETKALPTDQRTDGPTDRRTDGPTDGHTLL